ncbi:16S rRNA (uracil(1498)-N(3))-methyltransferase [Crocosphaera sp. XPORK-15E]|uniref:16S rRNA (uracil(1498)-N(3))-methyltransferase n=1 Tax=Crocosphaera sp. XPORK-15E TaxID=3110247 RepID=UPI002B20DE24|nr:16S rRNA (uracil(1498)-N(3))-methyltransferase [Crocosphaera sp. XPORK-15E]MEA5533479.1 16S rRNA (uracil(1498)-N(3))-methyltransferase [Crocosphaera sp. XPORK-15E]
MVYRIVITPTQDQGGVIHLNPEQRHYLKNVLRLKDKNNFIAIDGTGKTYLAKLIGDNAQIIENLKESTELPIPITLMISLPKGNGFDDIIRSCTELGVNTFIPVISQRTLLKPSSHKLERWRKIATEATEQSERQIVPQIFDPVSFSEVLINVDKTNSDCYICVTRRKAAHLLTYLSNSCTAPITIATGCEGGWTEQEVNEAIAAGFVPVSLGSRILRGITAPIVALSLVTSFVEKKSLP